MRDTIAFEQVPGEGTPSDVPAAAFGRFRLLHQIGTGSLGSVFRGEDQETHQPVTIKQLRLKIGPERTRLIAEELHALVDRMPDHPILPRVLHSGLDGGQLFFVTEFAPGESLDRALATYGPAALADALPRLRGLANALDAAASAGLWHGALDPSAIIVSAGDTRLIGLGLAPVLERARVPLERRGAYAAPEIDRERKSSPAADQFALGAIAYEWLFGRPPADPSEASLDLPAHGGADVRALSMALTTAMSPDPAQRFRSCSAFVEAVQDSATAAAAASSPTAPPLVVPSAEPAHAQTEDERPLLGLLPDERLIEVAPPEASIADLVLDPEPQAVPPAGGLVATENVGPSLPTDMTVASERESTAGVRWRGTLSAADEVVVEKPGRSAFGLLAAVLIGGVVLGILGGYLWGGWSEDPDTAMTSTRRTEANASPAKAASRPDARASRKGQPFTEAPIGSASAAGDTAAAAPPPDGRDVASNVPSTRATEAPARAPVKTPPSAAAPDAVRAARTNTARLLVRSTPAGATVSVDGVSRGTTPLALRDLGLGTRTLVVSRPGYVTAQRRITLTADRPSRSIEVALVPVPRARPGTPAAAAATTDRTKGSLLVESRPSGALVRIDGRASGTTPVTVATLGLGTHTVVIELPGYRRWSTTIDVKPGARTRVAASLEQGQE